MIRRGPSGAEEGAVYAGKRASNASRQPPAASPLGAGALPPSGGRCEARKPTLGKYSMYRGLVCRWSEAGRAKEGMRSSGLRGCSARAVAAAAVTVALLIAAQVDHAAAFTALPGPPGTPRDVAAAQFPLGGMLEVSWLPPLHAPGGECARAPPPGAQHVVGWCSSRARALTPCRLICVRPCVDGRWRRRRASTTLNSTRSRAARVVRDGRHPQQLRARHAGGDGRGAGRRLRPAHGLDPERGDRAHVRRQRRRRVGGRGRAQALGGRPRRGRHGAQCVCVRAHGCCCRRLTLARVCCEQR